MTQLTNNTVVTPGMVTCNTGATPPQYHVQNSFWRAFSPSAMGINLPIDVTCITYGVEFALAGALAAPALQQPIEIRLRKGTNMTAAQFPGTVPAITHTQLISQGDINGAANKIITRGMATTVTVNPNDLLVVELYLPDGLAGQNVLFPGSNNLGQTSPGYLSAPGCGITVPTPFAGIGFPNVHLLLDVHYVFTGATIPPVITATAVPSSANPGFTDLTLFNTNLMPGHEIWNIYSWQPCPGGTGTGAFLGLCFLSLGDVLPQLTTPLGFAPFHFLADNCAMTFGPFPIPSGIIIEVVTVDYNSMTATLNGFSPAIQIIL
ncbi:MAG: hypothetical protein EXS14_07760 [Planctomycetes bacterium]|nr:hypothetical protein [Planctomycetota bacterium]